MSGPGTTMATVAVIRKAIRRWEFSIGRNLFRVYTGYTGDGLARTAVNASRPPDIAVGGGHEGRELGMTSRRSAWKRRLGKSIVWTAAVLAGGGGRFPPQKAGPRGRPLSK